MKKTFRFTAAAILLLVLIPGALFANGAIETPMQGRAELVVLHTNDFHGHPLKFYNYPAPDVGGLPAIATLVADIRDEYEHVLVLDAGDMNTGRPESNFYESAPDIIGYNYVGYDAMVLGNHEFDKPLDVLEAQKAMASFPFLSANVKDADGNLLAEPYIIRRFGDLKVGIFGLTLSRTPTVTMPSITGDLIFEDEVETARRMVAELEMKTDIIIALTHIGLYEDNTQGSRRVAAMVPGIDLIVDGHSHSDIDEAVVVNGTPIVQAWQWGMKVGKAVLTIEDGDVVDFEWEAIPVNLKNRDRDAEGNTVYTFVGEEIEEDPFLLAALTPYADQVEAKLSVVIGEAADVAIQNGGGVRAAIPDGEITKKLIYEVLPFDNSVMTVDMTGAEVKQMFDFIPTISRGGGAFPQVSEGVSFTVDFTTGEVRDLRIRGRAVDENATYKVATNSFMAVGGDGYTMMVPGFKYDTSAFQRDVVIDYIMAMDGPLRPTTGGRITVIE